ncbi:MAG TPA: ATP-binding protein [bacterium]|nr:ATP-binding protein [bacterium]
MFNRWMDIDTNKSALIIGPRRSGKTTFLKNSFPEYKYATLDDLDFYDWALRDPKGFVQSLGNHCIIDEIQRAPKLTIAVKYAIDNENAHIIMTGSSSLGLLDSAAETLAGRINIYSMPTACWGEEISNPKHSIFGEKADVLIIKNGMRNFEEALTYGQFPEIITLDEKDAKKELLVNYRNTYFIRDVMQLSNLENVEGLYAIFANICRSIGSHLEVSNFARESSLSVPTTKKYLNTLYQSELAFKLYGYQYGPAKRYIKAAKTYFADNGIIESFNQRLSDGQLLENFVISELEKRRKLGFIKTDQFYYYKSSAGREIDLVFESENILHAIEIKSVKTPSSKDITNLREFARQSEKEVKCYLFYLGEEYSEIDGIHLIPVYSLFCGK